MQSFAAEAAPQAKRRKLDHAPKPVQVDDDDEDVDAKIEDADQVEEPEEGPETATEGVREDENETEDSSDPFEAHFAAPDDNTLTRRLKALELNQWTTQKMFIPELGKVMVSLPGNEESKAAVPSTVAGPAELKLKQKLAEAMSKQKSKFDPLEKSFAPLIFGYQDVFYSERNTAKSDSLRRLACLHAINHVFK